MTGLFIALSFLTRIPTPRVAPEQAANLARAVPWLPVVGALVGLLVALAVALGGMANPWVGALLGVLVWVLVTGGLHIDGLADVADALGAAHGNRDRFIEVARDPHLGSFGAIAIALQLASKLVLLSALAEHATMLELVTWLALTAAWARWSSLLLGRVVPPLSAGLGSRLAAGTETRTVVLEGIALGLVSLFVAPLLLAAIPLALALALYWRLRLGGMTGDCHGASIEITESLLMVALLAS